MEDTQLLLDYFDIETDYRRLFQNQDCHVEHVPLCGERRSANLGCSTTNVADGRWCQARAARVSNHLPATQLITLNQLSPGPADSRSPQCSCWLLISGRLIGRQWALQSSQQQCLLACRYPDVPGARLLPDPAAAELSASRVASVFCCVHIFHD